LSTATLEAMAHAKTVVLTNIPENFELIDHSGVAFPVDDVRILKDTLDWLLHDPTLVQVRGQRAQEFVRQRYSWNAIVAQLERIYYAQRRVRA